MAWRRSSVLMLGGHRLRPRKALQVLERICWRSFSTWPNPHRRLPFRSRPLISKGKTGRCHCSLKFWGDLTAAVFQRGSKRIGSLSADGLGRGVNLVGRTESFESSTQIVGELIHADLPAYIHWFLRRTGSSRTKPYAFACNWPNRGVGLPIDSISPRRIEQ